MTKYPQNALFHRSLIVQKLFFNRITPVLLLATLLLLTSTLTLFFTFFPLNAQNQNISFGNKNDIQLIDPDGHNQATVWLGGDIETIDLALYPLSTDDFLTHYQFYDSYQTFRPDLTNLTPITTWQESLAPTPTEPSDKLYQKQLTLPTVNSGFYILTTTGGEPSNDGSTHIEC